MLCDRGADARRNERRRRRNVEGARAVASRPGGVEQRAVVEYPGRLGAHHVGHAGDLGGGLALQVQGGQEGRDLRRRRHAGHDLFHRIRGLLLGKVLSAHKLDDLITDGHSYLPVACCVLCERSANCVDILRLAVAYPNCS